MYVMYISVENIYKSQTYKYVYKNKSKFLYRKSAFMYNLTNGYFWMVSGYYVILYIFLFIPSVLQ